ncbi:hypothetical protein A1O7_02723 [Cladophialophora yegresii CBS 114405]|uniref:DUF8035 domain-containing protein n=1 Tax=Cladophialophora yegresii CBS 114405 TaxID=1182544 RepID=W9WBA9_9EURO|nr:uncharacterized protein A1O7_02723 [Cladophialophora yegresii CBS 114405]EXJ62290.1 hypothetical protein A1O7_02723 [Cladophialophora yegresii CBS 114405]
MTENRYRPSSPPGRRYADPRDPRASTGMFISSSFDPARYSSSSQPRSVIDTFPASRHGSVYSTQGIAKRQVLDDTHPGGGSIVRTEYAVRPRNNSTLENRRPVSNFPERRSSPPLIRPAIVSGPARDDPRSPALSPREEQRYLVPAASTGRHHQRHASATRAEQERLLPARVSRQPEYHRRGGYNAYPSYSTSRGPLQDEGFSYTTPKEQFLSESSRPPQRRDSHSRRERPVSMIGLPEYRVPARRDTRDAPPPSSTRALDRIERNEPLRHTSGRTSDTEDRGSGVPRRRHSTRAPVLHHYPEDGYSSNRDDRDSRPLVRHRPDRQDDDDRPRHRHREERDREPARDLPRESDRVRERDRDRDRDRDRERDRDRDHNLKRLQEPERPGKPRSRESSPDHSGLRKGITAATVGAVGVAAGAAIKNARNKDDEASESDGRKERKHRRRRHHHTGEEPSPDDIAGRLDRELKLTNGDRDHRRRDEDRRGEEVEDDEDRRERRRHHRHRKHKDRDNESDTTEDFEARESRHRRSDRDHQEDPRDAPRQHRDSGASREEDRDVPPNLEQRTISPGEEEDGRPRKVQLVEPAEKKEEYKPKGILKPPREVPFPEDPNPTREGVAPLKDAQKDGIPPNARWTKISRALVNPEALEKAHERYEERDDYVIILRVVSKEEIMKLAEKTKEIREARERKWQAELEEKRRRRAERGEYSDESDGSYTDDDRRPLPALEQAPPVQGWQGDPRVYFAQQQQQQREEVPITATAPPLQPGMPNMAPLHQGLASGAPYPPQQAPPVLQQQQYPTMPVPDIRVEPNVGNYANNV